MGEMRGQAGEIQRFLERFCEEEQEILALTGPSGFGGGKVPAEKLWTASIGLAAWKRPGEKAQQGQGRLTLKADEDELHRLQAEVKGNTVIRVKVRRGRDGDEGYFLMAGPAVPASDPELEGILAELLKPVHYDDPRLGRFTLDRQVNWFEAEVTWMGRPVNLSFDWDEDEAMADSLRTAHRLFDDQAGWHGRILRQASDDLLELKNENWLDEDEAELDAEAFEACLELESIEVRPEGEFCFWFGDGDLFWGHSVTVEGTVAEGPTQADMQG